MYGELLPLFPLGFVLFPRTRLPLHIFEDRYKEMMGEVLDRNCEFGVVLAGEKGVLNAGCTALVHKVVRRYPDGRLDIVGLGCRRFEILQLDSEKTYLRGAVEFFNDEEAETPPEELKRRVFRWHQALRELSGDPEAEPEWDDPQLSFQLAHSIADLNFRQRLLVSRSEAERMRMLDEFLPMHVALQRHAAHVRAVAPRNGCGRRQTES